MKKGDMEEKNVSTKMYSIKILKYIFVVKKLAGEVTDLA